ncbi:SpoIVB peptidase [Clostridium gasigenes]|uniref:Stage IV sporulation protein B n=1 Tax=Clostridium gasigenes TaxID=94869 RepID=A0A1H0N0B4_9CLOT|nr:SpoIVB peptidase [Clostridium gasigenes]MBU3087385.1 SpoIVB peptidase [Clostridium gasigenes]MBU3102914.1 SpoIVB peptidase [Clostridium gasigenes]MBU3131525.1 SpoIVB peptidase [Clostridium gasigenes]MBU3135026.1 SpoIVB peptidase [Clostridium gasigenes]NKF05348.1 SpoIVB peptidase [Clostridium gasigenes]
MSYKRLSKYSIVVTPILILGLIIFLSLRDIPEVVYINNSVQTSDICFPKISTFNKLKYTKDKLKVSFLGLIPLKSVSVQKVNDLEVYPGGSSVGVRLSTEGVLVVGHFEMQTKEGEVSSPGQNAGIELGDVILKVNGEEIQGSKDLSKKIKDSESQKVNMELMRDEKIISKEVNLLKEEEEYKLGLWVRDSTAGIGTLTFYHKETSTFGALGHPITDGDTNKAFRIKTGELLSSSVLSVRKGEKGTPGELKGLFINDKISIGSIDKNTKSGIFGKTENSIINESYSKPMKVGFRSEIKEGPAKIITSIDQKGPKEYDIEIVKLLSQDEPGPKSMVIKVTDQELLEKTGGIVQGMSGSPIIQNNKLVGAVTHVLINKPDVGYGIYIEWMLKDAGVLN